jgi:Protein of unknown function (DUF2877)
VIVAAPVVGRRVRVVGAGREVAYGEDDGFVVVLTRERPVLPNGGQVGRLPRVGEDVLVRGDEVWDPTLRIVDPPSLAADGPEDLVRAVESRDPSLAASVGARLIGRGGGLTPEGDDLVAGVAAVVAVGSWPGALREAWVGALIGGDLRSRTTALSATLLELAALGMGPEPLQALLAGDAGALARLEAIGHSTGRAIARGAAAGLLTVDMRRSTTPAADV